MGLWMPLSYMKVMNIDRERSLFIATSMNTYHYDQWSWLEAMNIDRYDHCSYWFMHECAVHAMKGYWSCMKTVDHSYEQALIMHDNVHIHVIMNIIVTPTLKPLPSKLGSQYVRWSTLFKYDQQPFIATITTIIIILLAMMAQEPIWPLTNSSYCLTR